MQGDAPRLLPNSLPPAPAPLAHPSPTPPSQLRDLSTSIGASRVPLPEETYPRNHVTLQHAASGWRLTVDTAGALRAWSMAQEADPWHARADGRPCDATSFDWTYSGGAYRGDYPATAGGEESWVVSGGGSEQGGSSSSERGGSGSEHGGSGSGRSAAPALPLDRLRRRDVPILFYASVPLYADELHDRGRTEVSVKLRVMPDSALLLLRRYTRIDGVCVSLRDVRWFLELGDQGAARITLLRDTQERSASMAQLRALLGLPPLELTSPMLCADRLAAAARVAGCWLPPWLAAADARAGAGADAASPQEAEATAAPPAPARLAPLGLDVSAEEVYAVLPEPAAASIARVAIGA